jgi:hypothetical protein
MPSIIKEGGENANKKTALWLKRAALSEAYK